MKRLLICAPRLKTTLKIGSIEVIQHYDHMLCRQEVHVQFLALHRPGTPGTTKEHRAKINPWEPMDMSSKNNKTYSKT